MEVAWETLLAQAQANRGLVQVALEVNASSLDELARANRVMAEALLVAMTKTHDCCEHLRRDELQAWFHDAHEVAAVGSALDLIGGGTGEAVSCSRIVDVEAVGGMSGPRLRELARDTCEAAGLCTPPTSSGGHRGDTTPPKVPAFPTAGKGCRIGAGCDAGGGHSWRRRQG